jgi:hypothetical protein
MSTKPDVPPPASDRWNEFDPSEPAILHDRLNDTIVAWTGDKGGEWKQYARPHSIGELRACFSTDGATCLAAVIRSARRINPIIALRVTKPQGVAIIASMAASLSSA